MKRLLALVFIFWLFFSSLSFAATTEDVTSLCKSLLESTKGTKLEKNVQKLCNLAKPKLVKQKKSAPKPVEKKLSDTKISLEQVKTLLKDSIISWNPNARYIILEYSDLQCPFCQRHFNAKTLQTVVDTYKWKVAKTFRSFPLSFHQLAMPWAIALECAAQQNKDNYFKFIEGVFAKGLSSETVLSDVAKELKIDEKLRNECLKNEDVKKRVQNQFAEWQAFWVTGTPGNIILDRLTGQYKVIAWAYPADTFIKALDEVLK